MRIVYQQEITHDKYVPVYIEHVRELHYLASTDDQLRLVFRVE